MWRNTEETPWGWGPGLGCYYSVLYHWQVVGRVQLQEAIRASIIAMEEEEEEEHNNYCSETLYCKICMDTKSRISEMFRVEGCSHWFCGDCMSKHIAAKVEEGGQRGAVVKCPEAKCRVELEPERCGSLSISKEVMERWGDGLVEAMMMKMKRIYCPFEECSGVMVYDEDGEGEEAVECLSCWRLFCGKCRVGWHDGMECVEFEKLRKEIGGEGGDIREDVMTMKLARNNKWKRCSECNIYVDKIDGCSHITCMCGSEFCYNCGSKWSSGHACTFI